MRKSTDIGEIGHSRHRTKTNKAKKNYNRENKTK
jgi:hypothetical protein